MEPSHTPLALALRPKSPVITHVLEQQVQSPKIPLETDGFDANERQSMETSINLNDDLAKASDYSEGLFTSQPSSQYPRKTGSFRHSIDADSSYGSAYFQMFNNNIDDVVELDSTYSPLGPNSIFELTIASDVAREKRRAGKVSVTLNGGLSTVYNLKTPTTKDIPPINLLKLKQRIPNEDITKKLITDSEKDYKSFNESYKTLTADTLQRFMEQDKLLAESTINDVQELELVVPAVFSDPNFRLDDPRIFKQVIGDCNILPDLDDIGSAPTQKNLANNDQLQDQLSHYLDVVEISLINEISKSSNSFFNTVEDIQSVLKQSGESVDLFDSIMDKLDEFENNSLQSALTIVKRLQERHNVEFLESAILQISYITSGFELAKLSFNQGRHARCLNEIIVVEKLIRGEDLSDIPEQTIKLPKFKFPLLQVSTLPALINIQNDLHNLKNECSRGYITDFNDLLVEDLRQHCRSVSNQDTLNRLYYNVDRQRRLDPNKVNRSYQDLSPETTHKLGDYVANLVKAGQLATSFNSYQDRIIVEIKDIIKTNLPKSGSASADMSNAPSRSSSVPPQEQGASEPQTSSNSLSMSIRNLTTAEFDTMLVKIYCGLSECLRRLTKHQKVLLDLALSAIPSDENVDIMAFDLTLAINKAIELTQIRISKVINVRLEQVADLPVSEYLRFYSLSSVYLQECELINPGYVAGGAGSSLNDWIKNHIGYFVHRFHLANLRSLVANADKEIWREVTDIALLKQAQREVDEIVQYGEFIQSNGLKGMSGDSWLNTLVLYDFVSNTNGAETSSADSDPVDRLRIGDEQFMVPKLTLNSISQIKDYLIIAHIFPHKAALVENNLMNYFKLMNSKASQSVLFAGATRTAGLRHITTKHIALCIQFIEFNITLLPSMVESFLKVKPGSPIPQQNGNEELSFPKLISYYKDHENQLFAKLVSIMKDRTVSHCEAVLKLDLSEPIKHPRQCHPYMETLVKDTTSVTKTLSKYLPEAKYSLILLQIFDNYKKSFVDYFCTRLPQFKDFNEKHSLMKDIDYFRVKLCELPGYGNSGQVIWENVNALPTIEDSKMEEVMKSNIEGERRQQQIKIEQEKSDSQKASLEIKRKTEEKSILGPDQVTNAPPESTNTGHGLKEESKDIRKEESKEESNEGTKGETKDEPTEEPKEEPVEQLKEDGLKKDPKEVDHELTEEQEVQPHEISQEEPTIETNQEPEEEVKHEIETETKETPMEETVEVAAVDDELKEKPNDGQESQSQHTSVSEAAIPEPKEGDDAEITDLETIEDVVQTEPETTLTIDDQLGHTSTRTEKVPNETTDTTVVAEPADKPKLGADVQNSNGDSNLDEDMAPVDSEAATPDESNPQINQSPSKQKPKSKLKLKLKKLKKKK